MAPRWLLVPVALVFGILFSCLLAEAQRPGKAPRVGYLSPSSPPEFDEAFRKGLRDLGYVEGEHITVEYRWARGNFERLPDLAAELVRLKVDLIVAVFTQASLAAKNATRTIPIVIVGVADPVEAGLVASVSRPEGNITGTSSGPAQAAGKQLELLKEILPKYRDSQLQ